LAPALFVLLVCGTCLQSGVTEPLAETWGGSSNKISEKRLEPTSPFSQTYPNSNLAICSLHCILKLKAPCLAVRKKGNSLSLSLQVGPSLTLPVTHHSNKLLPSSADTSLLQQGTAMVRCFQRLCRGSQLRTPPAHFARRTNLQPHPLTSQSSQPAAPPPHYAKQPTCSPTPPLSKAAPWEPHPLTMHGQQRQPTQKPHPLTLKYWACTRFSLTQGA
jgi:hypothetical protein